MKHLLYILVLLFFYAGGATLNAQNSLTREKRTAHYPFIKFNGSLQYNEDGLQFANENPPTQLTIDYGFKNLALMQKGITKFLDFDQAKIALSLVYLPPLTQNSINPVTGDSLMISRSNVNVAINNIEFRFKTKFDRTSLRFGYIGLPYGRSPKISSDYSLIPGLAGSDFKFSKDVGVRFDFPVTDKIDASAAFTLGGLLSGPLMSLSFVDDGLTSYGLYSPDNYSYDGNWLLTGTIKTPTFKSKDYGVSVAMGHINSSHKGIRSNANVFRIAPYLVLKSKDHQVFTNQLSIGFTNYEFARTQAITWISQFEQLIKGYTSIYVANRIQLVNDRGVSQAIERLTAGVSVFPTPLLTLRLNVTYQTNLDQVEFTTDRFSTFFQVIYGIGNKL